MERRSWRGSLGAGVLIAAAIVVARSRWAASGDAGGVAAPQPRSQRPADVVHRIADGGEEYRFLMAILAGVALGFAATALQSLLPAAGWSLRSVGGVILWLDTLTAVILVYLSAIHGSRFVSGRMDAPEVTGLILVTIAEGSMFSAFSLPPTVFARYWLCGYVAFSIFAVLVIYLVRRRAARHPLDGVSHEAYRVYLKSLTIDICTASSICVATIVLIICTWPAPSSLVTVAAGTTLFASLVAAHIHQFSTRRTLTRLGALDSHGRGVLTV